MSDDKSNAAAARERSPRRVTTRHVVLTGAALVGVSTAATSAVSLYQLAALCGIPAPLAAALPIALDAGAGVAALVWITERGELRAWGRGVAVAALAATVVGNGVQHAITAALLDVTLPLVLAVGACIPAMLFACVHLIALMTRPAPAARATTSKPRKKRAAAATVADAVMAAQEPAPTELASRQAADLTAKDWARANWPVTAKEIQVGTGVTKGSSHRIRTQILAEQEAAS